MRRNFGAADSAPKKAPKWRRNDVQRPEACALNPGIDWYFE
jgi:hypothetical protein